MAHKKYDLAVVIHSLKIGGSERFTVNLVNGWVNKGICLLLILLENDNPLLTLVDPRVEVLVLNRKYRYDLLLSFRIQSALSTHAIDKVFCVEPYAFFLTRLASTFRVDDRQYFLSLHHSEPTKVRKHMMDIVFLRWVTKQDRIIFICRYQQICFRKKYFFRPSQHAIVYNGIDTSFFSPYTVHQQVPVVQQSWRRRLRIQEHEQVILMVGRLSPEKGHRYAIEALAILHDIFHITAHLVIIGEGDVSIRTRLEECAVAHAVETFIHVEGSHRDVRPFLLNSDMFTLTSSSETFSLAALEALSMGLPVSLTDVGGAKEMLQHEQLGCLATPMEPESIAASWASILKRSSDRIFIRNWTIQHFREENMVAAYVEQLGLKR